MSNDNQDPIPQPDTLGAVVTKPPRKPRTRKKAIADVAGVIETAAEKRARERREELAELAHDEKVSGYKKKTWLRYLLLLAVIALIAGFGAVVAVYLVLAWKAGTPFDSSIINGVFGVLKEGIGSMLGL